MSSSCSGSFSYTTNTAARSTRSASTSPRRRPSPASCVPSGAGSTRSGSSSRTPALTATSSQRPPAQNDEAGVCEDADLGARVGGVHDEVGRRALLQPTAAEPGARAPAGGVQRRGRRQPGPDELGDLLSDEAVGQRAPGVRADEDRHAGLVGLRHGLVALLVQPAHVRGVDREPLPPRRRVRGEVAGVHQGRHDRPPAGGRGGPRLVGEPGAVLDAVDARLEQVGQAVLAEAVRRHPRALLVGGLHGLAQGVGRPTRGQVADLPVDPVAHELDPAVAAPGLGADDVGEFARLDLVREVADVALGAGDVAAGSDDAGQVLAFVDPAGVGGRPGVAQEQGAGVPVGGGLLLLGPLVDRAVRVEPDVAVRVDEAGQHPALDVLRLVDAAQRRLVGEAAAHDPGLGPLLVGAEQDASAQVENDVVRHRGGHGSTLADAAESVARQRPRNFSKPGGRSRFAGSGVAAAAPLPRPKAPPGVPDAGPAAARCAASRSCWARLAGLPDFALPLRGGGAVLPLLFLPPPIPGIPGMPGMPPPRRSWRIIFCASANRSMSWLTSLTWTPEPLAMRSLREPLRMLGRRRSIGVIDLMIASTRSISRSSKFSSWSRSSPMPGSMPSIFFSEPMFLRAAICWRKSSNVKSSSAANFAAIASACSASNARWACSMRVSTSPMSRIRDAIRSGWNSSKSSSFSPVLANMMGRPVMPATDSAAPPRASPSSLESTTPVKPTPSSKARAVVTAS